MNAPTPMENVETLAHHYYYAEGMGETLQDCLAIASRELGVPLTGPVASNDGTLTHVDAAEGEDGRIAFQGQSL